MRSDAFKVFEGSAKKSSSIKYIESAFTVAINKQPQSSEYEYSFVKPRNSRNADWSPSRGAQTIQSLLDLHVLKTCTAMSVFFNLLEAAGETETTFLLDGLLWTTWKKIERSLSSVPVSEMHTSSDSRPGAETSVWRIESAKHSKESNLAVCETSVSTERSLLLGTCKRKKMFGWWCPIDNRWVCKASKRKFSYDPVAGGGGSNSLSNGLWSASNSNANFLACVFSFSVSFVCFVKASETSKNWDSKSMRYKILFNSFTICQFDLFCTTSPINLGCNDNPSRVGRPFRVLAWSKCEATSFNTDGSIDTSLAKRKSLRDKDTIGPALLGGTFRFTIEWLASKYLSVICTNRKQPAKNCNCGSWWIFVPLKKQSISARRGDPCSRAFLVTGWWWFLKAAGCWSYSERIGLSSLRANAVSSWASRASTQGNRLQKSSFNLISNSKTSLPFSKSASNKDHSFSVSLLRWATNKFMIPLEAVLVATMVSPSPTNSGNRFPRIGQAKDLDLYNSGIVGMLRSRLPRFLLRFPAWNPCSFSNKSKWHGHDSHQWLRFSKTEQSWMTMSKYLRFASSDLPALTKKKINVHWHTPAHSNAAFSNFSQATLQTLHPAK